MTRSGWVVCAAALAAAVAGCDHPASTNDMSGAGIPVGPTRPAATEGENTWSNYLAQQGKLHGKGVGMRPYIYIIPGGDSVAANDRRQNETDSIVHSIGSILIPGGMLILGGPDAKQTTMFITDLSKQLKPGGMKGIIVMVVSDVPEQVADTTALNASGATVRFVTM